MSAKKGKLTNSALAEIRFRKDLTNLAQDEKELGQWVIYSKDGEIARSSSEDELYSNYKEQLAGQEYFVGRILPEPSDSQVAEVNLNWFVTKIKDSRDRETATNKR